LELLNRTIWSLVKFDFYNSVSPLCLKDILYVRKNDNSNKNKSIIIDENDRDRYRKLSVIDHTLYEYFYLKLWRQINMEVMFHEEVLYFKTVRNKVEKHCFKRRTSQGFISSDLTIPKSYWNEEFKITAEFCTLLLISEMDFVIKIRDTQYGRWWNVLIITTKTLLLNRYTHQWLNIHVHCMCSNEQNLP
jgi:hypothetical protein